MRNRFFGAAVFELWNAVNYPYLCAGRRSPLGGAAALMALERRVGVLFYAHGAKAGFPSDDLGAKGKGWPADELGGDRRDLILS